MVSSEPDFDFLEFRINGVVQTNISGQVGWQQVTIPVAAGTNSLEWRYYQTSVFDSGLDAGFVDQFSFASAPVIVSAPASTTVNQGATLYLSVAATGSPTLGYHWQQNNTPIGQNASVLTLGNVGRAQDGSYSVTITNAGGTAGVSNIIVRVNVPQMLGQPVVLANGTLQFTSADRGGGVISASDLPYFQAQDSPDLINWVTLPNVLSLTNGMLLLQDPAGVHGTAEYYRILELPH
jgi:hypothetical protein